MPTPVFTFLPALVIGIHSKDLFTILLNAHSFSRQPIEYDMAVSVDSHEFKQWWDGIRPGYYRHDLEDSMDTLYSSLPNSEGFLLCFILTEYSEE